MPRLRKFDRAVRLKGNLIFHGHEVHRVPIEPSRTNLRFQRRPNDYLRRGHKAGEGGGSAGRAIGFVMVTYRKLASPSIAAIERALRARLERLSEAAAGSTNGDLGVEDLFEDGDDQDDIGDFAATSRFFADEEDMLRNLIAAAAPVRQTDEKLRMFLGDVVAPLIAQNKRLLVFTEYRATQTYLQQALQKRFPNHEFALINGPMNLTAKLDAILASRGSATFMTSTKAGGKSINLQHGCHVMANYDLPWNPARLVQRIGRLYRCGQNKKVIVITLHAADSFDNQAVSMMMDRVMTVARKMAPVGAEFSNQLSPEILGQRINPERFRQQPARSWRKSGFMRPSPHAAHSGMQRRGPPRSCVRGPAHRPGTWRSPGGSGRRRRSRRSVL